LQISGVSLTLTWPRRLCLFRILLGATASVTCFPLSKHTRGGGATPAFSGQFVNLQFMWRSAPSPLSSGAFLMTATVTGFPAPRLLGGGCHSCLLQQLVYLHFCDEFPLPPLWCSGHPALFATCLFLLFLFSLFFFSFFPGWGSVCPGGYADLAQGCLWKYHVPLSSPGSLFLLSQ
jgi:hypothetical protein